MALRAYMLGQERLGVRGARHPSSLAKDMFYEIAVVQPSTCKRLKKRRGEADVISRLKKDRAGVVVLQTDSVVIAVCLD